MQIAKWLREQAEPARQFLKDQGVSGGMPGSILADMQAMIDFIGPAGVPTQSKHGSLPNASLPELNQRLSAPIKLQLNRPVLRDYPNIAGIYILLRVMNLTHAERGRLCLSQEALSVWNGLNATEKYFALLEAWLFSAEDAVLGASSWTVFDQFDSNLSFLTREVTCRCWKSFTEHCHTYPSRGGISTWNVQLQARFGLVEIQARPLLGRETTTRGWLMQKAKRTPWGEAVAWAIADLLSRTEEADDWYCFHRPEEAGFGFLHPAFAPHFPGWKRMFREAEVELRSGWYVFKAVIEARWCAPAWRRLVAPGTFSLDDLATAVLKAFDFYDLDHLYEFRYQDHLGKARRYYHPECNEGPWASEIALEESGLLERQIMKFRFDFGDDWRFQLLLERIEPLAGADDIQVIAGEGPNPKQYPTQE